MKQELAFNPVPSEAYDKIVRLERSLLDNFEQVELPIKHYFSKGVYARELFIPKGMVLTGKIHKHENLNIISKGDISIMTERGFFRVQAPYATVSPPGTKRAGYAHEDTVWTCIHGTDETDLEVIERLFIAQDYQEYLEFCDQQKLLKGA